MLSKSISYSTKVNELSSDFARLLYTWIIPHLDDWGRTDGNSQGIKLQVMPGSDKTVEEFEKALQEMNDVGLIDRYEVEGKMYIQYTNFDEYQWGLKKSGKSKIPSA